ncbi:MAG: DUF2442 domain-containing protein [Bacteroidetes bacterium]|nr:MAG: DUF2442 domain-containing protein [Bacteroidota bacterium]
MDKAPEITADTVVFTDTELKVHLSDGRTVSVPIAWYPRLMYGNNKERNNWQFIAGGIGIHWPELDEDISIEGIILGRRSYESKR